MGRFILGPKAVLKLVAKLRKLYPEPKTYDEDSGESGYCVGGAFVMYINGDIPFPDEEQLGDMLYRQNNALRPNGGVFYAERIIWANDNRKFNKAWDLLEEALAFKN